MVTIMQLTDNLKSYISSQLESMSKSSPVIGFMKPLITRALDKNFSKITKALELIADKDGNVDVEGILTEMMENTLLNLKLWIWYLICITLRGAESIVDKSLIYIRQRKFVKGIEE